jgi:hypothetical protein
MKINIAILFLAAFFFSSCKSNSTSTSSNNNNNNGGGGVPTTANTMVYTAGGVTYTDTAYAIKNTSSNITTIAVAGGSGSPNQGLGFGLVNETTTGTYTVGPITLNGTSPSYSTMEYSFKNTTGDSGSYSSPTAATSSVGNITVTSISATNIQATFNGTLTLLKGNGPQTIVITNGGVNATIQ